MVFDDNLVAMARNHGYPCSNKQKYTSTWQFGDFYSRQIRGKVNRSIHADYKGSRVYFCCPSCVETFKADPEKYIRKMEKQGVKPEKAPVAKTGRKKQG